MINSKRDSIRTEALCGIWHWVEAVNTLVDRLFPVPPNWIVAHIFRVFVLSALHKLCIDFVGTGVFDVPLRTHTDRFLEALERRTKRGGRE